MNKSQFVICFFGMMGFALNSQAQIVFTAKVLDKSTQQALAGVEVFCTTTNNLVTTDNEGLFRFTYKEKAIYPLVLFNESYETAYQNINLKEYTRLDILMEKLSVDLPLIEIAAQKKEWFSIRKLKDVEGTTINAGKKSEVVVMDLIQGNLANNTSRQIYAQVAGLNIYEGSDGGLQLSIGGRGLDPNRTANFNTRQNDYDISADVLGYPENYYTPPAEAIKEIQIIRGASALQYGTQFGGLINFKLHQIPSYKNIDLKLEQSIGSYGLLNSFNRLGFNHKKWSFNSFYHHKQGKGFRNNSNYKLHQVYAQAAYQHNSKTKFSTEATWYYYLTKQAGGLTDEQFAINPTFSTRNRNWLEVNWKLYQLHIEHQLNENTTAKLQLFALNAQRNTVGFRGNPINLNENPITALDEQDLEGSYLNPRDVIKGKFNNVGAEAKVVHEYKLFNNKSIALAGAKYYHANNSALQGAGTNGTDADFSLQNELFPNYPNQSNFKFPNRNLALFVEHIFYVNDRLSITPGFRFEYINTQSNGIYRQITFDNAGNPIAVNDFNENKILKRNLSLFGIGLEYKANTKFNLFANLSQNYRSVTFSDIRIVSPTFIVDPDIKDERGYTSDIGIRGRWKKILSYDAGLYAVLYNDRIGIILNERANRVRKNIGKAFITGFESLIDLNLMRWIQPKQQKYATNYFVNMAYTWSRYSQSEENNVTGNLVEFVPAINLKSGIQFGYKNLTTSFQLTYLSKQFTDAQNSAIAQAGDQRSGIVGEIPAYHILDFSASYLIKKWTFKTGINNLTNKAYFTRRATGYPGPGIIPSEGRSFYFTVGFGL